MEELWGFIFALYYHLQVIATVSAAILIAAPFAICAWIFIALEILSCLRHIKSDEIPSKIKDLILKAAFHMNNPIQHRQEKIRNRDLQVIQGDITEIKKSQEINFDLLQSQQMEIYDQVKLLLKLSAKANTNTESSSEGENYETQNIDLKMSNTNIYREENGNSMISDNSSNCEGIQTENVTTESHGSLALLVDCENIPQKYAREILRVTSTLGDCITKRIYGKPSRVLSWKEDSESLGFEAVNTPQNVTGKNCSDISMVVGTMDLFHSGNYDGFVIASSDSDFTTLANRMQQGGKFVAVIGHSNTPVSLRSACDVFIAVENLHYYGMNMTGPSNLQNKHYIMRLKDV